MKIILQILISLFLLFSFSFVHAEDSTPPNPDGWKKVKVVVTEKIPGVECTEETISEGPAAQHTSSTGRWICEVPLWMKWVLIMLGRMIRWFTAIALIWAVLFLVINGIHLSAGWLDGNAKSEVKKRIMMTLGWIILLLLAGPILKLIAPWVYV
jgi:hypothetical protein